MANMMTPITKVLIYSAICATSFSTYAMHGDTHKMPVAKSIKQDKSMQLGTVIYLDIEGGFYGIKTSTGEKLLPVNLKKEYKLNGTEIRFKGKFIKDMVTIVQWGTPFELTQVELIKKGHSNNNATH